MFRRNKSTSTYSTSPTIVFIEQLKEQFVLRDYYARMSIIASLVFWISLLCIQSYSFAIYTLFSSFFVHSYYQTKFYDNDKEIRHLLTGRKTSSIEDESYQEIIAQECNDIAASLLQLHREYTSDSNGSKINNIEYTSLYPESLEELSVALSTNNKKYLNIEDTIKIANSGLLIETLINNDIGHELNKIGIDNEESVKKWIEEFKKRDITDEKKVEFEKAITVAFNNPQEFKEIHSGNQPVAHIKSTVLQVASLAPSDTIWFRLAGPNYKRASATYSDSSAGMGTPCR